MNFQNNIFAAYGGAPVPRGKGIAPPGSFPQKRRAAPDTGRFSDDNYFCKAFRKRTGQTPAKFRNGR